MSGLLACFPFKAAKEAAAEAAASTAKSTNSELSMVTRQASGNAESFSLQKNEAHGEAVHVGLLWYLIITP